MSEQSFCSSRDEENQHAYGIKWKRLEGENQHAYVVAESESLLLLIFSLTEGVTFDRGSLVSLLMIWLSLPAVVFGASPELSSCVISALTLLSVDQKRLLWKSRGVFFWLIKKDYFMALEFLDGISELGRNYVEVSTTVWFKELSKKNLIRPLFMLLIDLLSVLIFFDLSFTNTKTIISCNGNVLIFNQLDQDYLLILFISIYYLFNKVHLQTISIFCSKRNPIFLLIFNIDDNHTPNVKKK